MDTRQTQAVQHNGPEPEITSLHPFSGDIWKRLNINMMVMFARFHQMEGAAEGGTGSPTSLEMNGKQRNQGGLSGYVTRKPAQV